MISFHEAIAIIKQYAVVSGHELLDLNQADGRVLAADVLADRDYPPFNRSAMDGYAIMAEDWHDGLRTYKLADTIFAGQVSRVFLKRGYCYKIMTGASVPLPANVVIRVEDSSREGTAITLSASEVKPFMNIARQGQDLLSGEVVAGKFSKLTPQLVSVLAAVGKEKVEVRRLPSVAVVTTGDEVVPAGQAVLPYQIRNSNSYLLRSMLKESGIVPEFIAHVPDEQDQIRAVLSKALVSDLVIINGGVSAGDADYVPQLLAELNVKKLFHKVAIRPGKPLWLGIKPDGGLVFALPGNPFSCMITFNLFVKLYLSLVQGMQAPRFLKMPFEEKRAKKVNLNEFFPVRLNETGTALKTAAINGSGDIRLGLHTEAIALHDIEKDAINPGDLIDFFFL